MQGHHDFDLAMREVSFQHDSDPLLVDVRGGWRRVRVNTPCLCLEGAFKPWLLQQGFGSTLTAVAESMELTSKFREGGVQHLTCLVQSLSRAGFPLREAMVDRDDEDVCVYQFKHPVRTKDTGPWHGQPACFLHRLTHCAIEDIIYLRCISVLPVKFPTWQAVGTALQQSEDIPVVQEEHSCILARPRAHSLKLLSWIRRLPLLQHFLHELPDLYFIHLRFLVWLQHLGVAVRHGRGGRVNY
eukprot:3660177-Rhodomonas_salina.1